MKGDELSPFELLGHEIKRSLPQLGGIWVALSRHVTPEGSPHLASQFSDSRPTWGLWALPLDPALDRVLSSFKGLPG